MFSLYQPRPISRRELHALFTLVHAFLIIVESLGTAQCLLRLRPIVGGFGHGGREGGNAYGIVSAAHLFQNLHHPESVANVSGLQGYRLKRQHPGIFQVTMAGGQQIGQGIVGRREIRVDLDGSAQARFRLGSEVVIHPSLKQVCRKVEIGEVAL